MDYRWINPSFFRPSDLPLILKSRPRGKPCGNKELVTWSLLCWAPFQDAMSQFSPVNVSDGKRFRSSVLWWKSFFSPSWRLRALPWKNMLRQLSSSCSSSFNFSFNSMLMPRYLSFLRKYFPRDFEPRLTDFLQPVERRKPFWSPLPWMLSLITVTKNVFLPQTLGIFAGIQFLGLLATIWLITESKGKIWMILKASYRKK